GGINLGDYIVVVPIFDSFQGPGEFTISGLGEVPTVDIYLFWGVSPVFDIPGASSVPFVGSGIYTSGNTLYYANVPVANGTISGTIGSSEKGAASTVLYGMTIQKPFAVSPPGPLSIAIQGNTVVLSWPGTATLQAADELTGTWVDIATTSPQNVTPAAGHKFYRLRH
ncbi:MAG: hypothetical protein M1608_05700, partial [Candidatus Omnitrophica bacterium]|nr:hypothetical protein [Candidatus Omnitrophota bacterium]